MGLVSCTLLLLLTCVTIHALCSFLARTIKQNFKLPPGPSPLPIIGNLLELGEKPHLSLSKLARIHGPIMSLKLGEVTTIVVSSANIAKEVLLTHDQFLSNRPILQSVSVLNHEHYSLAFMPVSPLWRELRKICNSQLLSHRTLDSSQDIRRKKLQEAKNYSVISIKLAKLDLFIAGTDTTATALEWAVSEVLRNPDVMLKAKQELGQVIGKGNPVEETNIAELSCLQAIIKETFRLHPPVPFLLPKKASRDVFIRGYTVPKDAQVLVNVWSIGRDHTSWDNSTSFSPERFLNSEIDVKGQNYELAPFGAGRRICPGLQG